jgi:hypothetical protein
MLLIPLLQAAISPAFLSNAGSKDRLAGFAISDKRSEIRVLHWCRTGDSIWPTRAEGAAGLWLTEFNRSPAGSCAEPSWGTTRNKLSTDNELAYESAKVEQQVQANVRSCVQGDW